MRIILMGSHKSVAKFLLYNQLPMDAGCCVNDYEQTHAYSPDKNTLVLALHDADDKAIAGMLDRGFKVNPIA